MSSKADPYSDITCSPSCRLPPPDRLEKKVPPANLERQLRIMQLGLRRVAVEALDVRTAKGDPVGVFQRFSFVPGADRKPQQSPRIIAALVMDRAEAFARERDHLVKFRVYIAGKEEGGTKDWEKHVRVTVDPSRIDDDDDEDGDEDDDEDSIDDEGDEDPEESEDDDDDDANDQEEYDDEDEDEQPVMRREIVRAQPRDSAAPYVDQAMLGRLEPAMQVHPAVPQMQAMGLRPDLSNGVPLEMNPNFLIQLIERQNATVARIWTQTARESRRDRRLMRREFVTAIRESRRMMKIVVDDAHAQRDAAYANAEKLGQQIIDITSLNRELYENYQKIAAHSWKAFRHSMETETNFGARMLEYERKIFEERLAHAEERAAAPTEPSQWPGMLKGAMPTVLGIGSFIAGQRGDSKMAAMLGQLAKLLAPRGDDDEEYLDDEESGPQEDVVEAEASEPEPEPEPERPPEQPSPTRDNARELLDTIDAEQTRKLREILPRGAWDAFEQTASALTESSARASVSRLDRLVRRDNSVQMQVLGVLRPEQTEALFQLVREVQRRRVPSRPRAAAAATG